MVTEEYYTFEFPSDYNKAKEAEDALVAEAESRRFDEEAIFALRLSLEEALVNAIRHGNKEDVRKKIYIRYRINAVGIDIFIRDEGRGFDPKSIPDPTTEDNLEIPNGRGIMLMRAYMNAVEYNQAGNEVHLVKYNQAS